MRAAYRQDDSNCNSSSIWHEQLEEASGLCIESASGGGVEILEIEELHVKGTVATKFVRLFQRHCMVQ